MNTRDGTIRTAAPRPTRQTRALPNVTGHWQWKGTIPTGGPSGNRRSTAADMRRHTATHMQHEPHSGHPLIGRQRGTPGTASPRRRPRRWASNQQLRAQPLAKTTPGQADLARDSPPSLNPTTHDHRTHSADAC